MKTAMYEFKCRRCGEIKNDTGTGESNALMFLIEVLDKGSISKFSGMLSIWNICHCEDGGVGVSDIIGYNIK